MPHIELMNFDLDPLKYGRFVRAFVNNVKENVDDSVKLDRLVRICAGKASKVIESCVVMEPNVGYKRTRELLFDMSGNTYTGVYAWIQRVAVGQVIFPMDCDGLRESADDLRNCGETLKAMGYISRISSQSESVDNFVKRAEEDETVSCNTTGAGIVRVALPIVPARVRASNSLRNVETYALLDTGSTSTFCSERLVDELQLDGETQELTLTTFDKEDRRVISCVFSLELAVIEGDFHSLERVLTRPSIPIKISNIGQQCESKQWRHLGDIEIPEVDATSVMLLIGQDYPDNLMPRELRSGDVCDPYATRTLLGWTLT